MGLIKVEINLPEIAGTLESFARDRKKALEGLISEVKTSVGETLNSLLKHEIELFLGRPDQQNNKLNGYYVREYSLKGVGAIRIKMPRDRNASFESTVVPKHERMDPKLKEDMAILHLSGISTRTMAMISRRLLGVEVSSKTISNSLSLVTEAADNWLQRPITQPYWALYIDGTNFNIQRRGSTQKEPSLVVLGIDASNRRSILAIEPGTRDNCDAWRAVFRELKRRGLDPSHVRVGIMDGLPGLERLFKEEFCESVTARCWAHAMRNACAKAPERLREGFKLLADKVMYASSEGAALEEFNTLRELLGKDCERAVKCLEKDLQALTVHYRFDQRFWRGLKTTNCIERIHKEFKRRTRSMESLGDRSLKSVLVFTALKLEMGWRTKTVDSNSLIKFGMKSKNIVEQAVEEIGLLH